MNKQSNTQATIRFFLIEFLMVFLGVLFAFWINDLGERIRNKTYVTAILRNISDDIRKDSANIQEAIAVIDLQYESLNQLTRYLSAGQFDSANRFLRACYISYNAFEPNTQSYQSMIYAGDLKLIDDYHVVKLIKEIDQANQKMLHVHSLYYQAVEDVRNTFICKEDMENFNVSRFQRKVEFWNRVNFLQETYLKNYARVLRNAQTKYNQFLVTAF